MSIALLALTAAVIICTKGQITGDSMKFEKGNRPQGILDSRTMRSVFFRSFTSMGSFNYKGYNNIGYVYSITPALKKIYAGDEAGYQEALVRNCEFFNSHPYFSNLIMGVSLALEEQKAKDGTVSGETITATKAALMGPLAGIGDSVFQGTYRVIFSAIGAGLCMAGNVLGCFIYLIPQIILSWGTRWGFLKYAYVYGTELVVKLKTSNLFDKFMEGANIVGMMVIAAMTSSFIAITLKPSWNFGGSEIVLQSVFDAILPKLLPLLCMLGFYKLMESKKKGIYICLGLSFAIGFVGVIIGLL
jgi:mannose/fructose/N-acetylgalactosamine-specific phosphotransferase system component IID